MLGIVESYWPNSPTHVNDAIFKEMVGNCIFVFSTDNHIRIG